MCCCLFCALWTCSHVPLVFRHCSGFELHRTFAPWLSSGLPFNIEHGLTWWLHRSEHAMIWISNLPLTSEIANISQPGRFCQTWFWGLVLPIWQIVHGWVLTRATSHGGINSNLFTTKIAEHGLAEGASSYLCLVGNEGMIHWLTINNHPIPPFPSIPY